MDNPAPFRQRISTSNPSSDGSVESCRDHESSIGDGILGQAMEGLRFDRGSGNPTFVKGS